MKKMLASCVCAILLTQTPFTLIGHAQTANTQQNKAYLSEKTLNFLTESDIARGYIELENYINKNSELSQNDINNKATEILQKISNGKMGAFSYGGDLNPAEKKLVLEHPGAAIEVFRSSSDALATSKSIFKTAASLNEGNGDAFRHAYWNALMTKRITSCTSGDPDAAASLAKKFADAHENGSETLASKMDYSNNSSGRKIALDTWHGLFIKSFASDSDLKSKVLNKIDNGSLKRISNNKIVGTNSNRSI